MTERKTIESCDMSVSAWSGGKTTQIAIFPEDAVYAERNFIWRISAATVETAESDFTVLRNYDRIISSLRGRMLLTDENGRSAEISPLETVFAFDGGANIHCAGKAKDINLMLRKDAASGSMEFLTENEERTLRLKENETALVYFIDENRAEKYAGADKIILPAGGRRALFLITVLTSEP